MKHTKLAYEMRILFEQKITSYYKNTYRGHLGNVQIEVLNYLYDHHTARTQEIANEFNISKQHASKILLRLEELGFLTHQADLTDKRVTNFTLLESGQMFVEEHLNESDLYFEQNFEKLSQEDQKLMIQSMENMISVLKKL